MGKIIEFPKHNLGDMPLESANEKRRLTKEEIVFLLEDLMVNDPASFYFLMGVCVSQDPLDVNSKESIKLRKLGLLDENGYSYELVELIMAFFADKIKRQKENERDLMKKSFQIINANEESGFQIKTCNQPNHVVSYHQAIVDNGRQKRQKCDLEEDIVFVRKEDDIDYGAHKQHLYYDSNDYTIQIEVPMINGKEVMDLACMTVLPKKQSTDIEYSVRAGINSTKASKNEFDIAPPSISISKPKRISYYYKDIDVGKSEELRKVKSLIKKLDTFVRNEFPGYAVLRRKKDKYDPSYSWLRNYSRWNKQVALIGKLSEPISKLGE